MRGIPNEHQQQSQRKVCSKLSKCELKAAHTIVKWVSLRSHFCPLLIFFSYSSVLTFPFHCTYLIISNHSSFMLFSLQFFISNLFIDTKKMESENRNGVYLYKNMHRMVSSQLKSTFTIETFSWDSVLVIPQKYIFSSMHVHSGRKYSSRLDHFISAVCKIARKCVAGIASRSLNQHQLRRNLCERLEFFVTTCAMCNFSENNIAFSVYAGIN